MTHPILQDLEALIQFELRLAERHGLPEVRITKPRARAILAKLGEAKKLRKATVREPKYFQHLDRVLA